MEAKVPGDQSGGRNRPGGARVDTGTAASAVSAGIRIPVRRLVGGPGERHVDTGYDEERAQSRGDDQAVSAVKTKAGTGGQDFLRKLGVGEDVEFGDADTPVCWWKPPGSKTYRVIYGDLSIRDVEPNDLPEIPWLKK